MEKEGYIEVLHRLNKVLHKLTAELSEIESVVTELNPGAHGDEMEVIEERPDLLIIAGILRETINSLKAGLERVQNVHNMQLPVLRLNSLNLEEDNSMRLRPSPHLVSSNPIDANKGFDSGTVMEVGAVSASYTEIFNTETRVAERAATARNGPQVCRHTCIHHPEMIDPGLWSELPEDLVRLVFARLPIPRIFELKTSSTAWSSLSDSSSFRLSFVEANPNLFGLLGWDGDRNGNLKTFRTRLYDAKSKEWHGMKLNFPLGNGYVDSWYACDGGLVCFVPKSEDEDDACKLLHVYVCNPLLNVWKALPDLPLNEKELELLQLVTDVDANSYRVFLVYRKKQSGFTVGVDVYDSQTGSWGTVDSGLVFGSGNTLLGNALDPAVFDCSTKEIFYLTSCPPLDHLEMDQEYVNYAIRYSILKDRLFVLHAPQELSTQVHSSEMSMISEYEYQSSTKELKKLNDYKGVLRDVRLRPHPWGPAWGHLEKLFTSTRFILSTWVNCDDNGDHESRHIRFYDMAADEWHHLPTWNEKPKKRIDFIFMCELRWDAAP